MRLIRHIQRPLAGLLSLWLSGLVLLVGCQASMASAVPESCPMARKARMSHHCPKSAPEDPARESITRSAPMFECCAFLPLIFDKARKVEPIQKIAFNKVVDRPGVAAPPVSKPGRGWQTGMYRARISDHQGTFIKNRILRI